MHTVQQKLGHTKIAMTADTYAHVLDEMQVDAAARLAKLLHG
jgi:integrase